MSVDINDYNLVNTTCEHCSSRMNPDNSEESVSCCNCDQVLHAECMASYDQDKKEYTCEHCNENS